MVTQQRDQTIKITGIALSIDLVGECSDCDKPEKQIDEVNVTRGLEAVSLERLPKSDGMQGEDDGDDLFVEYWQGCKRCTEGRW